MTAWGRWSHAQPIEVYPSSDSSLPTNISSRKKWRKTEKRGLANKEELLPVRTWSIETPKVNVLQVSEEFTSCKGSKVVEIWTHMQRESHWQDKRSDLCAEAGLCLYFCCCQVWRKLAPAGFSFPRACWCSLLRLIIHVILSPASCRVLCWDTSVWCQVSWSLKSKKARGTHTHGIYMQCCKTQIPVVHTHTHTRIVDASLTCVLVLAQTVDHCDSCLCHLINQPSCHQIYRRDIPSQQLEKG